MFKRFIFIAAIMFAPLSANAYLVDFEGVPDSYGQTITAQGFDFSFAASGWAVVSGDWACCVGEPVASGSTRLALSGGAGSVIMSLSGGGIFSFGGFSAATALYGTTGGIDIIGTLSGGGTISTTVSVIDAFDSFFLDSSWSSLTSVSFTANPGGPWLSAGLALDDLYIDEFPSASVPEASSLMMLGLGLLGFGFRQKRKYLA